MENRARHMESLLALYTAEQRRKLVLPDAEREETPHLIRHVQWSGGLRRRGWVLWSDLTTENADAMIEAEIAYLYGQGVVEFEWRVFDGDTPTDLRTRLRKQGFALRKYADSVLMLELHDDLPLLHQPIPPQIRRLQGKDDVMALMALLKQVWWEDFAHIGYDLNRLHEAQPEAISMYGAFDGERMVSGAWLIYPANNPFAALWGGSTLSTYRQRGYYTGLLAIRAQEAHHRGRRYLSVDASQMSRPIMEKWGFLHITNAYSCTWHEDLSPRMKELWEDQDRRIAELRARQESTEGGGQTS